MRWNVRCARSNHVVRLEQPLELGQGGLQVFGADIFGKEDALAIVGKFLRHPIKFVVGQRQPMDFAPPSYPAKKASVSSDRMAVMRRRTSGRVLSARSQFRPNRRCESRLARIKDDVGRVNIGMAKHEWRRIRCQAARPARGICGQQRADFRGLIAPDARRLFAATLPRTIAAAAAIAPSTLADGIQPLHAEDFGRNRDKHPGEPTANAVDAAHNRAPRAPMRRRYRHPPGRFAVNEGV